MKKVDVKKPEFLHPLLKPVKEGAKVFYTSDGGKPNSRLNA